MAHQTDSPMQPDAVRKLIIGILHSHSDADIALESVSDETPLLEAGLCLDSVDLLNSILEIEDTINLRIGGEDMTQEVFATVGGFADHVCGKVAASEP